jgi:hypothetical protein
MVPSDGTYLGVSPGSGPRFAASETVRYRRATWKLRAGTSQITVRCTLRCGVREQHHLSCAVRISRLRYFDK